MVELGLLGWGHLQSDATRVPEIPEGFCPANQEVHCQCFSDINR